jgi:hypothetical protein
MDEDLIHGNASGLGVRQIILVLLVVGAVTSANLWLHRSDLPLGQVRYSNYGFSIDYPRLYEYHNWGRPDSSTGPNEFGGGVQFKKYWEGTWNNVMIMWNLETSTPDLEAKLDEFYISMDNSGCHIDEKYEQVVSEKDGYQMLRQTYTFTEESFRPGGAQFIATTGVWCEPWPSLRSNRVYVFTYIAFLENTSYQQVNDNFQHYLDSFNGHYAQTG